MALVNRPSLALMPPVFWTDLLSSSFMKVAPPGLDCVFTAMCGSCSNENAYKVLCLLKLLVVEVCVVSAGFSCLYPTPGGHLTG